MRRLSRTPAILAGALAALWLPLTGLAMAMGWRSTFQIEQPTESMFADFAAHGSAISGPLLPHVVMAVTALLSRRPGRVGQFATGSIGLLGLLLVGNAIAGAVLAKTTYTPRSVIVAGALFYLAFGAAFIASAVTALFSRARGGPPEQ